MFSYAIDKEINADRLTLEIQQSTIIPSFYIIGNSLTSWEVIFKAELSDAELATFNTIVTNHVPIPLEPEEDLLKSTDKRIIVKPSVRPLGKKGYFTGYGDNPEVYNNKGDGTPIIIDHKIGDPTVLTISQYFNIEGNKSYIWNGYLQWTNAKFDTFSFEIRPRVTIPIPAENTQFYKHPTAGIIVPVPSGGDVSLDPANTFPVSVTPKTDTGICPAAYWNADYSAGVYSNFTPATNPNHLGLPGNGKYNLFWADICLKRYINKFIMLGDNKMDFIASDISELATNLKLNYIFTTVGEDHEWQAVVNISMFREKI